MKIVIALIIATTAIACNKPLRVTGRTDAQATTSGKIGPVEEMIQMPALDAPANRNRIGTLRKQ